MKNNILYVSCCSKYSDLKLGGSGDVPEYNDVSWFAMLMGSGVTNGMLFYSVFEPIYHYTSKNRYSANPTLPDNQLAQTSLLLSMYHIGNGMMLLIYFKKLFIFTLMLLRVGYTLLPFYL